MFPTAGGKRRLALAFASVAAVAVSLGAPARPATAANQRVERTGTVRLLHEDDFKGNRTTHRLVLRADGKDFLLKGVDADSGPKAGATVRVAGNQEGSSIAVSGMTTLAHAPAAAAVAPATGRRETAVVLFNFSNNTQRPFTTADALARIFTGPDSTNAYYKETSDGALSLVGRESAAGDVFGWYTIPQTNSTCDFQRWADSARAAAAAAGHVLTEYDNVVYVFPRSSSCRWGGVAYIGDGPNGMGESWSNGYLDTGLVSHELGHNFGMHHASTLACTINGRRVTVAEACTPDEYGDPFDVMGNTAVASRNGNSYGRQVHSYHREQARLMPPSAVTTVTSTGDYTLTAGEMETGTRSVRVPLKGLRGWNYYLELRTPEGRFDDFAATSPAVRGVSIRLSPEPWQMVYGAPSRSYLLDATPETHTFDDAPLPVGKTFEDLTYGKLALTVTSITAGVATIHLDMDVVPPIRVVGVNPPDLATGVPLDTAVEVTLSRPTDGNELAEVVEAFDLKVGGTNVPGSYQPTASGFTYRPGALLSAGSTYEVTVASERFNPGSAPWRSTFRTHEGNGPKVVAVDPIQGAGNVALDSNVTVTFEAPVDRASAQAAFSLQAVGAVDTTPGVFSWDAASTIMTFDPSTTFHPNAQYRVDVSKAVKDPAATTMATSFQSTFITLDPAPTIIAFDPSSALDFDGGAPIDTNVTLTFSRPMNRGSVQTAFRLVAQLTNTPVPGAFTWDVDSRVMTFNPSVNLDGNSRYAIVIDAGAAAQDGAATRYQWTSTFLSDSRGPTVTVTQPARWATAVALDQNVVLTFSEPVERNSAQAAFSLRRTGATTNVAGAFAWNANSTVMTFDPFANLGKGTGYTVSVAATVKDIAGNTRHEAYTSTFTTGGEPASVRSVDPAAGATNVALDRLVAVTFSEPMDRSSVQAAFSLRKTGTTANLSGAVAWDATSTVMTFNPYANLNANGNYTIAVADTAKDASGSAVGAFSSTFTTDAEGPTVMIDPAGGVTGVAVDRNVVVTFSEPVERNSAQSAFSLRPAGSSSAVTGAFTWNVASTVMTLDPYANLAEATPYTVTVAASAKDVAGNPLATAHTSTFATAGDAPSVAGVSPATGTTGVAVDRDIVVTFSEPVERNSAQAAFSLRKAGTATNLGGTFGWDAASTVMTFNPYVNLLARSTYTVDMSASVRDLTGALSAPFAARFATDAEAPTVAVDATAGATGVPVDRDIVVTFSEAVERGSAQAAFSLRRTGTTANLGGSFTWDAASRVMTFNPYANLAGNTGYTMEIAASVKDLAGIPMTAPVVSAFTTDAEGPAVATVAPPAGATGVAPAGDVVVTFSEPVERSAAQAAFALRAAGGTVNLPGVFTWNPASTVLTFNPQANLPEASDYTVDVAASAKDVAGNPMAAAHRSAFRTGGLSPSVTAVAPAAGATGVTVERDIVVTFSEPVERNSAQAAFSLRSGAASALGGAFSWNAASTVMTFNPYANLAADTGYTVAVAASLKDVAGNPMAGPFTATFTTDSTPPAVVGVDPATAASGVAVDRDVVVTFSEPVDRNSAQVAFSLRKEGTQTNLGGSFSWDAASKVMTFNPYANLSGNTGYTVGVATSARDVAGMAVGAAFSATFTTDAKGPTVTSVAPTSGVTDVAVDRDVVVTFSEPVERNSAQAAFSLRKEGTQTNLGGTFGWDAASTVMTFNPYANLAANGKYTIGVAPGLRDAAGNAMAAAFGATFATDGQAPTITTVGPAAAATGVAVDRDVVVTFSEPVDRNSAQAAFSLRAAGSTANVGGAFTWDATSKVMTFNPYASLAPNTGHTVYVTPAVKDLAGLIMSAPFTSTFTTA